MNKRRILLAALAALLTLAGRAAAQATPTVPAIQNDWVPCGPPGGTTGGPGEDVEQPGRRRVMIARSRDGLHFQRPATTAERLLLDQADVPDAVVLNSGRILVYFVTVCRDYTPFGGARSRTNAIAVAVSDGDGVPGSWVFKDVSFDNAAYGLGVPVDPNVVLWRPEQNLIRMFVSQFSGGLGETHSYTSTDGFTFHYEGPRYKPGTVFGIIDPENFRFDDTHWYIFSGGPNGFATSSDDGSTFTNQGYFHDHVTNVTDYSKVPHEVAVTSTPGAYRIFASWPGTYMSGIDSLQSAASPWTSWQWEGPVLDVVPGHESCEVSFPTVVRRAPDDWLMFYGTTIPNCVCGGDSLLYHCDPPASPALINAVVDSASSRPAIAPNSFVTIYGSNFTSWSGDWTSAILNGALPTALGGVQVRINGKDCFMNYASPNQLNVLTPIDSASGSVLVEVTTAQGTATANAVMLPVAPSLFGYTISGKFYAVAQIATDMSVIVAPVGTFPGATSRPAQAGDYLALWALGMGATNPGAPIGQVLTAAYPVTDLSQVKVKFGPLDAPVSWAGLVMAGLFQVNVQVPPGLSGDQPVMMTVNGVSTQPNAFLTFQ